MPITIEELEAKVLGLSAEDRARLLERLIASFDPQGGAAEDGLQAALRRQEEVRSGKVRMLPAEEALARAWAQLG